MSNPGLNIKDQKRRGEWAEIRFLARASELGMTVIRPWGDSLHYDLVVEWEGCLLRVQVKSTLRRRTNSYYFGLRGAHYKYTKEDFDFIAAYLIPLDIWYIIPADAAITGKDQLCITPGSAKARYDLYREAWHLLRKKRCDGNADLCLRRGCKERLAEGACER